MHYGPTRALLGLSQKKGKPVFGSDNLYPGFSGGAIDHWKWIEEKQKHQIGTDPKDTNK